MDKKQETTFVDRYEVVDTEDGETIKPAPETAAMGTVTLTDSKDIFLVPTPSADPRGAVPSPLHRSDGL